MPQAQEQEWQIPSIGISSDSALTIASLNIETAAALRECRNVAAPIAQVIRVDDVAKTLNRLGDALHDCGTQARTGEKEQTIELKRYLPHKCTSAKCGNRCDKIDLIRTSYKDASRTLQGITQLLTKPVSVGRLYLIAVMPEIFQQLLRKAAEQKANPPGQAIFLQQIKDDLSLKFKGKDPEYVKVRKQIYVASQNELRVLILGESGTGKEAVAEGIHNCSKRSKEKFRVVNCAAIPMDLLESELFGIEAGAAADVKKQRIGLWEEANGGTLFLDEIGYMSLYHQAKILRALQKNEIRRVGSNEIIKVDVRVIAATNKDIMGMIARDAFLVDLYSRLSEMLIVTPALRDSPGALKYFAQKEWEEITRKDGSVLPEEIIDELPQYIILGNYRDLKNALNRLYAYMSAEGLSKVGRRYFQEAMKCSYHPRAAAQESSTKEAAIAYRAECLQNLRKATRCIRQCKVALRPFLRGASLDDKEFERLISGLQPHHEDLEELCLDPSAFYGHETYVEVAAFAGRIAGLMDLLKSDPPKAAAYWDQNLQKQYDLCLTLIQNEIKQLI